MAASTIALRRYRANIKLVPNFERKCVCWIWQGETVKGGYARFRPEGHGRKVLVHRWAYEHFIGPIPVDKQLDHFRCDTPGCVKPTHVRPVTALENTRRARHHNANKTHCVHGHKFTVRNIYWQTSVKRGKSYRCRRCRICMGLKPLPITLASLTTRRTHGTQAEPQPQGRDQARC